jgi:outer membrane receptor protein involved in Fe transport
MSAKKSILLARRRAARLALGIPLMAVPLALGQQTPAPALNDEPIEMEKAVVTGSYIPTSELVGPSPVEVYNADELDKLGVKTMEQLVKTLPSAVGAGNFGVSRGNGGDGSASIALRGIPGGTLVLINGRRMPPNSNFDGSSVDLNLIPVAAIDRIEILKDGASALYGADAVAGVVNVILKKNYNATELSAYYGNTTEEDMGTQNYSFVTGYADGENSFLIGGSFYKQNALYSKDRDRSTPDLSDPRNTSGTSNPGRVVSFVEDSTIPPSGLVYGGPPGTTGTSPADYRAWNASTDRFPYPLYTPAVRPSERYSIFGNGEKALFGENLKFFADTMYSHTWSYNQLAPTPIYFPYFVDSIPTSNPYNVFGFDIDTMSYRTTELGPRTEDIETDMFRIVSGFKGQIADTLLNWEAAFLYGEDSRATELGGELSATALIDAINDTDPATAFNPFGNQANSAAQLARVRNDLLTLAESRLMSVDAKIGGELVDVPAGALGFAVGYVYTEERFENVPDAAQQRGDTVGFNSSQPLHGSRDINSAFAEFRIPVFSPDMEIPAFHSFETTVAVRFDEYSDFGDTWNPKVQVRWQPVDETVTLRGSYSTSFRPPTFNDLYLTDQESYPELRNPVRDALEAADPDGFDDTAYPIFEQIRTIYSGNPDLKPETADNYSAGVVYSPPFAKRLNLSVDWFKIDQENVPGSIDQLTLDSNFAGADPNLPIEDRPLDPNAPFSNLIQYNPNNYSYTLLYAPALNLSRRTIEGLDFRATYELPTESAGTFVFAGDLSYYYKFEQENIPGSGMQDRLGDFIDPSQGFGLGSLPRTKAALSVFWDYSNFEFGVTAYYIHSYLDDKAALGYTREIDSIWTVDLQASYNFPKDLRLTVGVQNVADTEPPLVVAAFADNYDRDTHSLVGRFVYGQITKKF